MTVWGETDGLLLSHDRLVGICKIAETPKLAFKGESEVIEK